MSATNATVDLSIGDVIATSPRTLSAQRAEWYSIGHLAAALDERREPAANIHTDAEIAAAQGLPAPIADGMHQTNWVSSLLTSRFGRDYLESGELRTKFIRPLFIGRQVVVSLKVTGRQEVDNGVRYEFDVSCVDDQGVRTVEGYAALTVSA